MPDLPFRNFRDKRLTNLMKFGNVVRRFLKLSSCERVDRVKANFADFWSLEIRKLSKIYVVQKRRSKDHKMIAYL